MTAIRAFIGIDFESECKKNIFDLQQKLRKYAIKGRWKHIDNFHLTLKFLDEITNKQRNQIDSALNGICLKHRPFNLETADLGVFTGKDAIRVLWLGLAGDLPQLHSLSGEIDRALSVSGFVPEKRSYKPHITLGQDVVLDRPLEKIREEIGYKKYGSICVKSLILFKSEQVQSKRVYTKISEYSLTV